MPETVIAGRYRLVELLGRGGMSEVWSAQDQERGRRVAIKLLAPNADTLRFEREARAVASLGHPNITQLYDYGEENGRPYMVLEYLSGGTLEDRLKARKPLPDAETLAIATGVAAGLAQAHARGVVHRDLKPANVLFDDEGRPKIADFGIARMAAGEGTLTEAGTVLGTAAYISPEQAMGEPATPASDVYSFGVLLYRMLTGRLPFEADDPMELVMQHRDALPPPVTQFRGDAPARLEATTMAALEKSPANRPADGRALLVELGAPTAGLTTATTVLAADDATQVLPRAAAPPPTAAAPEPGYATPPPSRSRTPIIVAALILLALAGAALAYAVTRSSSTGTDTGTFTPVTLPKASTTGTSTSTPATTEQTTSQETTTQQTTTAQPTTTRQQTTAPPPTTPAAPPPTTAPPSTTAPPPTTLPVTTILDTTTTLP